MDHVSKYNAHSSIRITSDDNDYFIPDTFFDLDPSIERQTYLCGYKSAVSGEETMLRVPSEYTSVLDPVQLAHDPARTEWENTTWEGFLNTLSNGQYGINFSATTRIEYLAGNARYVRIHGAIRTGIVLIPNVTIGE